MRRCDLVCQHYVKDIHDIPIHARHWCGEPVCSSVERTGRVWMFRVVFIEVLCVAENENAVGSGVSLSWADFDRRSGAERSKALTIDKYGLVVLEGPHSKRGEEGAMLIALTIKSQHTIAGSMHFLCVHCRREHCWRRNPTCVGGHST